MSILLKAAIILAFMFFILLWSCMVVAPFVIPITDSADLVIVSLFFISGLALLLLTIVGAIYLLKSTTN